MKSDGNGTVKLEGRDWLWLIVSIVGGIIGLGTLHVTATSSLGTKMEAIELRGQGRLDDLRRELAREAPAPAKWTSDAVYRLEKADERADQRFKEMANMIDALRERVLRLEQRKQ